MFKYSMITALWCISLVIIALASSNMGITLNSDGMPKNGIGELSTLDQKGNTDLQTYTNNRKILKAQNKSRKERSPEDMASHILAALASGQDTSSIAYSYLYNCSADELIAFVKNIEEFEDNNELKDFSYTCLEFLTVKAPGKCLDLLYNGLPPKVRNQYDSLDIWCAQHLAKKDPIYALHVLSQYKDKIDINIYYDAFYQLKDLDIAMAFDAIKDLDEESKLSAYSGINDGRSITTEDTLKLLNECDLIKEPKMSSEVLQMLYADSPEEALKWIENSSLNEHLLNDFKKHLIKYYPDVAFKWIHKNGYEEKDMYTHVIQNWASSSEKWLKSQPESAQKEDAFVDLFLSSKEKASKVLKFIKDKEKRKIVAEKIYLSILNDSGTE